jgi:hypothetical protein
MARFQQPGKDAGGLGDCVGDRLSHVSNTRPIGPLNNHCTEFLRGLAY